jgi:hypothetical protein
MPELGTYGSVRGALSNERPYRDGAAAIARRATADAIPIDPVAEA